MAVDRKQAKASKSESLTIRLDPKMRFALDFVARINGQTITKVIERSVLEAADRLLVGTEVTGIRRWTDYWDVSEGIRAINLAQDPDTHRTFEEEELLEFVRVHWNYFADDPSLNRLKRVNINVLWPQIGDFLKEWSDSRTSNVLLCVNMLRRSLASAGLDASSWEVSQDYGKSLLDTSDIDIPF